MRAARSRLKEVRARWRPAAASTRTTSGGWIMLVKFAMRMGSAAFSAITRFE